MTDTEMTFPERKKGNTQWKFTIKYFMEKQHNEKVAVCSQFFIATPHIGKRLVLYTIHNRDVEL